MHVAYMMYMRASYVIIRCLGHLIKMDDILIFGSTIYFFSLILCNCFVSFRCCISPRNCPCIALRPRIFISAHMWLLHSIVYDGVLWSNGYCQWRFVTIFGTLFQAIGRMKNLFIFFYTKKSRNDFHFFFQVTEMISRLGVWGFRIFGFPSEE